MTFQIMHMQTNSVQRQIHAECQNSLKFGGFATLLSINLLPYRKKQTKTGHETLFKTTSFQTLVP